MTPRQIEAFREVVLNGSMTAAALTLDISQPAMSRMIKDLSEELGFKLFTREKGRMVATREALALYQEVERSFIGFDKVRQAAKQIQELQSGRLRIAAMPALGCSLVPEVVDKVVAEHPDLALHIEIHSSPMIVDLLQEHQVDLGFVQANSVPLQTGSQRRTRFQLPCVCAFHREHRFSELQEIGIEDLDGEQMIELSQQSQIIRQFNNLCSAQRVRPKCQIQTSLSQVACDLVARGHGVSIVDIVNAESFEHPDFCYRPIKAPIYYDFLLMYPPVSTPSKLADTFVEEFSALLPETAVIEHLE